MDIGVRVDGKDTHLKNGVSSVGGIKNEIQPNG